METPKDTESQRMGAEAEKPCRTVSRVGTVTGCTMGEQGGPESQAAREHGGQMPRGKQSRET